jgi:hypothetical protein
MVASWLLNSMSVMNSLFNVVYFYNICKYLISKLLYLWGVLSSVWPYAECWWRLSCVWWCVHRDLHNTSSSDVTQRRSWLPAHFQRSNKQSNLSCDYPVTLLLPVITGDWGEFETRAISRTSPLQQIAITALTNSVRTKYATVQGQ